MLQEILEKKQVVEGISFVVSNDEVLNVGEWTITRFQKTESTTSFRSIEEINEELALCHNRLDELNEYNSKLVLFN